MHSGRLEEVGITPWDRTVDRKVQLEDARPVAKSPEVTAITDAELLAADADERTGIDVEQCRSVWRQVAKVVHQSVRLDPAALLHENVGDCFFKLTATT